jgi:hypothetical protein
MRWCVDISEELLLLSPSLDCWALIEQKRSVNGNSKNFPTPLAFCWSMLNMRGREGLSKMSMSVDENRRFIFAGQSGYG